jgi:hypothetical protein
MPHMDSKIESTRETVGEKNRRKENRLQSDELDVVTSSIVKKKKRESLNNNEEKERKELEEETEAELKESSTSNSILSSDSFMSVCQNLSNNFDFFMGGAKPKTETEKRGVNLPRRHSHQVMESLNKLKTVCYSLLRLVF